MARGAQTHTNNDRWRAGALATVVLALLAIATNAARGDTPQLSRELPAVLSADVLTHDRELGVVTATGNVEIAQGDRILLADTVSYSERDGVVTASGNISLLEPTGEVVFADYVELKDQMRNGFIRGVKMLLADNSRLAANNGQRSNGNMTVLERAVYSPCNLCREDPTRAPLWQVKAIRVIHDQQRQVIEYKDAVFEVYGFPVAYTPYFRHPDPTVKRQSGFLAPSIRTNEFFGVHVQTPYYWVIAPEIDVTITPQISAKQGLQLGAEYRQRVPSGEFQIDGSVTRVDQGQRVPNEPGDQEIRGHVRGAGRFRIDDEYRWGFNGFRTTDDTYLRRYAIPGNYTNSLTNRLFVEGIDDRQFVAADAYYWQSLLSDSRPPSQPIVVPMLTYSRTTEPDYWGGSLGLDASALSLYRTDGADVRRLSATGSWQWPFYSPLGDVYTVTAQVRGDGYWINEGVDPSNPQAATKNGFAGRARPLLGLEWRYPWIQPIGSWQHIVEPIASLRLAPYGGNPADIPNEDSQLFEFDETNLLSFSHFPGLDRYDGGHRLSYGLKSSLHSPAGGYSEILLGQVLRLREDDTFPAVSGLRNQQSDYVGRLFLTPIPHVTLVDRVRVDQETYALRRHEVGVSLGPPAVQFSMNYAALDRSVFSDELGDREAISLSFNTRLTQYLHFRASHLRDLGTDGGSLNNLFAVRYTDECLDALFFVERSYTLRDDLKPTTTFGVRFRLAAF